jgi:hypothetical protein
MATIPWRIVTESGGVALRELAARRPEISPQLGYLSTFLSAGPPELIEGANLERVVLIRDGAAPTALPVVVNDGRERRCYFLSPQVHYVDYMRYELAKMHGNAPARWMSRAVWLLGRVGGPLGFNRCASVNNWLLTTNPIADVDDADLAAVTSLLARRYPDYPLVFRSVDARSPAVRARFERAGYRLVLNRPVFEWSPAGPGDHGTRNVKREMRLLDRIDCTVDDVLRPGEEGRIAQLYRALYLDKHSGYNARYTARFFRTVADTGLMRFVLFRRPDAILGFVAYLVERTRILASLVGYDLTLDRRELPLYRAAVAIMIKLALELDRNLFLSTGAAEFKRHRGAYEWMEHEAVYDRHLPRLKRVPWWTFGQVLDRTVGSLDTSQM